MDSNVGQLRKDMSERVAKNVDVEWMSSNMIKDSTGYH